MPLPEIEIARRSFLALSAMLAASGASSATRAQPPDGPTLSFDEFLALANPLAKELVGDTTREGQDRYLLAIAALAVRLVDVPIPEMSENSRGRKPATFIGFNPGGESFTVLHWRMEPGSVVNTHPHTYGNVVTLVLDGDVRITNWEQVEGRDFDTKEEFRVRRSCDQFVERGGTNLVTLERNWMHGFVAGPRGARGLDITTRIREKHLTPNLELLGLLDETTQVHRARWKF